MKTLTEQLKERGFDVREFILGGDFAGITLKALQITDLKTAATVYVPESSTLEHALEMIKTKNLAFRLADNK